MGQVYPRLDARPRLTTMSRLRHRRLTREGVFVQLSEDVRTFLEEARFAVLGTVNANGSPQQTVMWYELRGATIVMNTRRGRKKDRNLIRDPRVSLCIEDGFRYVTLKGSIELVDDPATDRRTSPRWLVATTTPPRRSRWCGRSSLFRSG